MACSRDADKRPLSRIHTLNLHGRSFFLRKFSILLTKFILNIIMNSVQFGKVMVMNKAVTSREEILSISKEMAADQGIQAINMRNVAKQCGVAVGSVYNYFPSKNDLIIATVDAIWREIIQGISDRRSSTGFIENVEKLFYGVKSGGEKYPFFFGIHSMSIARSGKEKGRETMNQYFESLKSELLLSLQTDPNVKQEFFSERCTQTDFIEFVFSNLISLLIREQDSCDLLSEIIKGAIYKHE